MKFISVVTICKDHRKGLLATGESLVHLMTYCNIRLEWIVVDGSNNPVISEAEFKALDSHFSNLGTYFSDGDSGIYDAMNKGLQKCSGEYVWFLNAGDRAASSKELGELLDRFQGNLVLGGYLKGDDNIVRRARPLWYRFIGMPTSHQAMIFSSKIPLFFDLGYKLASDYDLVMRVAKLLNKKHSAVEISKIPICLVEKGGVSETDAATYNVELTEILNAFVGFKFGSLLNSVRHRLQRIGVFSR